MPNPINFDLPSPETLAGIYVYIEGDEHLTVRPAQIQPVHISSQPENGTVKDARNLAVGSVEARQAKRGD